MVQGTGPTSSTQVSGPPLIRSGEVPASRLPVVTPQELEVRRRRQVEDMRRSDFSPVLDDLVGSIPRHPLSDAMGRLSMQQAMLASWSSGQAFLLDSGACAAIQERAAGLDPATVPPVRPRDLLALYGLLVFSGPIRTSDGVDDLNALTWGPMVLGRPPVASSRPRQGPPRSGTFLCGWTHRGEAVEGGGRRAEQMFIDEASRELRRILESLGEPNRPGEAFRALECDFTRLAERTRQAYRNVWMQEYRPTSQRGVVFGEPVFQDDDPRVELVEEPRRKGLALVMVAIVHMWKRGDLAFRQITNTDGPQRDQRELEVPVWQVTLSETA